MRLAALGPRVGPLAAMALAISSATPASAIGPVENEYRTASSRPSVGQIETVSAHRRDEKGSTRVAVGWGGRVAVVWFRHPPPESDVGGRLFASVRRVDGVWTDPVPISKRNQGARTVDVAAGRKGQVSVVWVARRNDRRSVT